MASRSGGAFLTSLGGDLQKLGPQYAASKQMEFENIAELAKQERLESFEIMKMGMKHKQDLGLIEKTAELKSPTVTWQDFSVTGQEPLGGKQAWKVGYFQQGGQWFTIDQDGAISAIAKDKLDTSLGGERVEGAADPNTLPIPQAELSDMASNYEETVTMLTGPPWNYSIEEAQAKARAAYPLEVPELEVPNPESVRNEDVDSSIVGETGLSARATDLIELATQNSDAGMPDVFNDINAQVADEISSNPGAAVITIIEVVLEEWKGKLTASQREDLQYYREALLSLYAPEEVEAPVTVTPRAVEEPAVEFPTKRRSGPGTNVGQI